MATIVLTENNLHRASFRTACIIYKHTNAYVDVYEFHGVLYENKKDSDGCYLPLKVYDTKTGLELNCTEYELVFMYHSSN